MCSAVLTFDSVVVVVIVVVGVTIQMKPLWQYFCVVPFVFQYFTKSNLILGFFLNFDFWYSWMLKGKEGWFQGKFNVQLFPLTQSHSLTALYIVLITLYFQLIPEKQCTKWIS